MRKALKIIAAIPFLLALAILFLFCGILAGISYLAVRSGIWIVERLLLVSASPAHAQNPVSYEF